MTADTGGMARRLLVNAQPLTAFACGINVLPRAALACLLLCLACATAAHPGQHEQLARINRLIAQAPDQQELFIRRGNIYSEGGEYALARADYSRAQQLGPPLPVAFELGVLYYRMAQYERATGYLNQFLAAFPRHAPAYDYLARIARDSGAYDQALANLQTYFSLQEHPNPGHYLSAAKMLAESGRHSEALQVLDDGLIRLGTVPQLQRRAIAIELQRQQPAQAIVRLQTLQPMLGDSPAWKLEMAQLLVLDQHSPQALVLAEQALLALAGLRPTPARLALQQQARELVARLAAD